MPAYRVTDRVTPAQVRALVADALFRVAVRPDFLTLPDTDPSSDFQVKITVRNGEVWLVPLHWLGATDKPDEDPRPFERGAPR